MAEEEEIREEAGSVKVTPVWSQQDFLKVKVQKSSFDMLRTLQWTGCTRYIEEEKLALACPEGRLGVLQYVKMLVFSCCVRASKSLYFFKIILWILQCVRILVTPADRFSR